MSFENKFAVIDCHWVYNDTCWAVRAVKTKVKLFSRNVDLWEKANHGQDLCVRSTKRISGSRKRQRTSRLSMSPSQRFCDKYNRLFSLLNHFIQILNWSIPAVLRAIIFLKYYLVPWFASRSSPEEGWFIRFLRCNIFQFDILRTIFSKLICCGQHLPGWYIADNIFHFQVDILRTTFSRLESGYQNCGQSSW